MKTVAGYCLFCILLLSTSPARAATGWPAELLDWFTELFSPGRAHAAAAEQRQLDSLRQSPTGWLLNDVPAADTLAVEHDWPLLSLDVPADLDRRTRLLNQTVLLADAGGHLPLPTEQPLRVVYHPDRRPARFLEMARRFASVQEVPFSALVTAALPVAADLPTVIVSDDPPGRLAQSDDWYRSLTDWTTTAPVLFFHFGDVGFISGLPTHWSVLNCPLRSKESETFLAQALFGAQTISGYLDRSTPSYAAGTGITLMATRPGFRPPEVLGIDRERFAGIDQTINRAIRYRATPGAQLLVMKDGQVVYEKGYGHQTYQREVPVDPGQLYDLASVTKAAATSLAVMKLYDEGRIDLKARVRDYLPEFARKVAGRYRIDQLLTHHTGLQSDLPLYGLIGKQFVSDSLKGAFNLPLTGNRWLHNEVPTKIRSGFGKLGYTRRPVYRYSDVNYVLLQFIVEAIAEQPLDDFVRAHFYEPLGLGRLTYLAGERFPAERIVPTIHDNWMRGGLLRGFPHDEGAAMLGGVAGHAGLFANAHDLGRLFQLLNQRGNYAGQQLIRPETVDKFTARGPYNYRALGFDRLAGGYGDVIAAGASRATFGHTGFTGTCVWADPDNDLVYVLLTNRIHPDPKNERLLRYHTRGKVHRSIYRALGSFTAEEV